MNWENDARILFRKIDVNSDGALDQPELSSMLSDIGLLDGHIEQIFMQLDSDGDGQVCACHQLCS
jgi:Ca2+-binding EF-hand superfamily protein